MKLALTGGLAALSVLIVLPASAQPGGGMGPPQVQAAMAPTPDFKAAVKGLKHEIRERMEQGKMDHAAGQQALAQLKSIRHDYRRARHHHDDSAQQSAFGRLDQLRSSLP